jgi:hypothetical protein
MRHQAGQVLLAIRHFVSVAQEAQIKLQFAEVDAEEITDPTTRAFTDLELIERIQEQGSTVSLALTGLSSKIGQDGLYSPELISLTRQGVVTAGEVLSLIEDISLPKNDSNVASLVSDFKSKKDNVYVSVNDVVTAARTAMDEFAPPNALQILRANAQTMNKVIQDLVLVTKLLLEWKSHLEVSLLKGELDGLEDRRRDSDLSILQRRAMSLTFLHSGTASTPTSSINGDKTYPHDSYSQGTENDSISSKVKSMGLETISEQRPLSSIQPSNSGKDSSTIRRLAATESMYSLRPDDNDSFVPSRSSSLVPPKATPKSHLDYDYTNADVTFSADGQLSGGTLEALVERLTLHDQTIEQAFLQAFLLTFRCFVSPEEFVQKLRERFSIGPPLGISQAQLDEWKEKKQTPVRLRVFNVLKLWLDTYYLDVYDRESLSALLELAHAVIEPVMAQAGRRLTEMVQRKMDQSEKSGQHSLNGSRGRLAPIKPDNAPAAILPKLPIRNFTDIDPLELARQISIYEYDVFSQVQAHDLLQLNMGAAKAERAKSVRSMIKFSTDLSSWVAESILNEQDAKKRAALMKYWIKVADVRVQLPTP